MGEMHDLIEARAALRARWEELVAMADRLPAGEERAEIAGEAMGISFALAHIGVELEAGDG